MCMCCRRWPSATWGSDNLPHSLQIPTNLLHPFYSLCKSIEMTVQKRRPQRTRKRRGGNASLSAAARAGNLGTVQRQLNSGAHVNKYDMYQNTPLHDASERGHLNVVKMLLQAGADINRPNLYQNTPLHVASANGHLAVVLLLLTTGANPLAKNTLGQRPGDLAATEEIRKLLRMHAYSRARRRTQRVSNRSTLSNTNLQNLQVVNTSTKEWNVSSGNNDNLVPKNLMFNHNM